MADSGDPPPPSNAPVQGKKTAKQGMDYLAYLIKYFKTCGFVLPIWLLGYFNFSPSWVLLGLFAYLMGEEYRKVKDSKLQMARQSVLNEKEAILARTEDLPSWVFFPDVERAEWLNKMLKQMWPYIGEYAKDLLKTSVEPAVQNSLPNSLKPFKFETIDLGDIPPRIGGVKVYIENVKRDEIILDFELFYASDSQIKVAVRGLTAGIKDLTIHGHMRIVMRPLVQVIPIIGGLQVFFLNQPTVDFDLTNTANMLDVPLLSNTVRGIIVDQLSYYMVLPNKLPVQLAHNIDMTAFKYPQPAGVVRLHVVGARELKKADFKVMGKGKSDPYCKIYIGAKTFKTKVIENTIAPTWNSYFEAVVDQSKGQFIDIDVLDEDPGDDDELGSCSVDVENVANNGNMDSWLPLENVKTGMLHVRALWLHPSKDPNDLDKAEAFNKEQGAKAGAADDHLSSAILMVTLDSAKDLPRSKKSMSEPSPLVKLAIGNIEEKSMSRHKTTDPKWESNFHFLINNPRHQELNLTVIDSNKDKKLGTLVIAIKTLLTAPDMTINRPYQLQESGPNSKITLRLCLRVLTSEKPAAWARDDLPVRQASVPEGGTCVDTGTGDDSEAAPAKPEAETVPATKPGTIPEPIFKPVAEPVSKSLIETSDRIFYDLETSGLGDDVAILQLSAVCGDKIFDNYIEPPPKCYIHPGASEVTHLRIQNGRLTYKYQPVQTKPIEDVLKSFIGWLKQFRSPILMGHNIKNFDTPLVYRDMKKYGFLQEFRNSVAGFVDTYELFKLAEPGREGKGMYKQETLVKEFLNEPYDAHNGLEDVKALQKLMKHMNFEGELVQHVSFDMDYVEEAFYFSRAKRERMQTLKPMVDKGVLSQYMAEKIAASGLEWGHLVKAVQSDWSDGIRDLFTEPTKQGARVTNTERIIEEVTSYFQRYLRNADSPAKTSTGGVDDISMASSLMEQKAATLPQTAGTELRQRSSSNGAPGGPSLGSIQLTIRYSEQRKRLIVVVHKCINLIGYDEDNLSDPYVRIYLLPENKSSKRKTQVVKNDLNPIYDETFDWAMSLEEASRCSLDLMVKNKNSMFSSAKCEMGTVIINLSQLDLTKAHTDWFDLNDPDAPPQQILPRSTTA